MNIIYIRTSTEDQNPENQLADLKSMGIDPMITEVLEDQQSAWKDNKERESFQILLKNIKSKKVTDLYVWDWDRIYRNRVKLKEFFALCKVYKVSVHSFRQS